MSPPPHSKHPDPCLNELELLDGLGVSAHCLFNDLRMVTRELHRIEISAQAQAQLHIRPIRGAPAASQLSHFSAPCSPSGCPTGTINASPFINTTALAHDIQSHTLHMLCHTFSQLVEQLCGSVPIMCILNGVTELALRFKLLCKTPFASCDRLTGQRLDVHYSLRLQPSPVSDDGGFIKSSLSTEAASMGRLSYYRAQVQRNWEDEMDDSDTDDEVSEMRYGPERKNERDYYSA
ncbi:hypothetical protein BJX66DRAFT_339285 [Aspergillus keveii]|uniref:Uncharacterized protein n=1 Tax=Aspergillus keveii TaxID=714993 RepID=A0ABR4G1M7_9EURO